MRLHGGMNMALLGYARVSTNQQKLDLQIEALQEAGVRADRIFTDIASGKSDDRKGLQQLLVRAENGDSIVCTKLDRLGRNTLDMCHIIDQLSEKGVAIKFLEGGISTEGDMGVMVIKILAAVAEAERARILERTNEGRQAAMDAGIQFGRKPHKATEEVLKLIGEGRSSVEVIRATGVSRATYFRLKKQLNT
jgi:DNA invertase Pin-like site-specific DNA recombinase